MGANVVKQIGRTRREANIVYSSARLSCLCQPEEKTNREDEEVRSCMTFILLFTKRIGDFSIGVNGRLITPTQV